jgi:AcrR family transcriptional regulator
MGLRETNATRTRARIADAAMALFLQRGYDLTTMEDVAAAAEVGLSTLYRYFPTKELLGTSYLGEPGQLAAALRERPDDEPVELSLGTVLVEFVAYDTDELAHSGQIRDLIQENPRMHGRLLDWLMQTHLALTAAIAERRGTTPDDIVAAALSWNAVLVLERASDRMRTRRGEAVTDAVREVVAELTAADVLGPRLPPR